MADHKDISRVSRLEVIKLGRRGRWSDDEKIRVFEESYAGPRRISGDGEAARGLAGVDTASSL